MKEPKRPAVTRRDLAESLKEEYGGTISGHDDWIKNFIKVLSHKISDKGKVEIRGFGTFQLNTVKAHTTVSPASEPKKDGTLRKLKVPESYTVDFRASGSYKDRLKAEHGKKKSPKSKSKSKPKTKRKKSSKK